MFNEFKAFKVSEMYLSHSAASISYLTLRETINFYSTEPIKTDIRILTLKPGYLVSEIYFEFPMWLEDWVTNTLYPDYNWEETIKKSP